MNNKKQLTLQDCRHICLTCLKSAKALISIIDSGAAEMLNYCNLVSQSDDFPNQICSNCLKILKQSFDFKQMVENSYQTLKTLLTDKGQTYGSTIIENATTLSDFNINEDTSGDSNDALIVKCEKSVLINFNNKNLTDEEFLKFYKIKPEEKFENDDFISFLDKPLPPPLEHCCEKCEDSFNVENDLKIHQSVHNPDLICAACLKKFANKQMLKRHLKIHLIQKPHVCKICDKNFAESYALKKHLLRHSGVPREKKHLCTECGQGFSEPYYLKVHLRKHTGEKPLLCPDCHKPFADPRSYRIHIMIHTGEKPHKCKFCFKSFIQRANLTKHLRIHTGEKPYLCKLCDKRFSQSSTLNKHTRTHAGEKLHSYDKCGKRYADKATLSNHEKSHSFLFSCKTCGKKFTNNDNHPECDLC